MQALVLLKWKCPSVPSWKSGCLGQKAPQNLCFGARWSMSYYWLSVSFKYYNLCVTPYFYFVRDYITTLEITETERKIFAEFWFRLSSKCNSKANSKIPKCKLYPSVNLMTFHHNICKWFCSQINQQSNANTESLYEKEIIIIMQRFDPFYPLIFVQYPLSFLSIMPICRVFRPLSNGEIRVWIGYEFAEILAI